MVPEPLVITDPIPLMNEPALVSQLLLRLIVLILFPFNTPPLLVLMDCEDIEAPGRLDNRIPLVVILSNPDSDIEYPFRSRVNGYVDADIIDNWGPNEELAFRNMVRGAEDISKPYNVIFPVTLPRFNV